MKKNVWIVAILDARLRTTSEVMQGWSISPPKRYVIQETEAAHKLENKSKLAGKAWAKGWKWQKYKKYGSLGVLFIL